MKLFGKLLDSFLKAGNSRKEKLVDYKQEYLLKLGREQFKKLTEKGLGIPVVLL